MSLVELVSVFEEIYDSEPDFALEPENGEDCSQDKERAEHHVVCAVEASRFQKSEMDSGEDADGQVQEENDAPNNNTGEGFGLFREKGGKNTGKGPVLLVSVGIPCHNVISFQNLVISVEFVPEGLFQTGQEEGGEQIDPGPVPEV